VDIAQF